MNCELPDAVILAGGSGRRLQGIVGDRPKPMAPVAGRPFLEWLLLALRRQGLRRVVLCTGYMAPAIEDHFGDGKPWGLEIVCSREPVSLGTGGAVRFALPRVVSDPVMVLNGDSYCRFEVRQLREKHAACNAQGTIWLVPQPDRRRFGNVALDSQGKVVGFSEKPSAAAAGLISAGVYLLSREAIGSMPEHGPASLEHDLFPRLVGRGLYGVVGAGPFLDIGTPEAYAAAEAFVAREMAA